MFVEPINRKDSVIVRVILSLSENKKTKYETPGGADGRQSGSSMTPDGRFSIPT